MTPELNALFFFLFSIFFSFNYYRTMHRKYTSMKNALSVYGGTQRQHRPVERDPSHPDFQSIASKYQHDPERSRQRMRMREERLRARESYDLEEVKFLNFKKLKISEKKLSKKIFFKFF